MSKIESVKWVYDKEGNLKRDVVGYPIRQAVRFSYVYDKDGNIKKDTAGYPIKKINEWLTADIDKVVTIDEENENGNKR